MHYSTKNSIFLLAKTSLCLTLSLLLWQCSQPIEPKPLTYTQLLTGKESKAWKLTSVQILDNGNAPQTISSVQALPGCIADDLYVFYANAEKKFEVQEGASTCQAGDPELYLESTWTFVNSNATLEFPFTALTSISLPYVVKELTEKSLTIEYYFEDNASYRFIFTAQQGG